MDRLFSRRTANSSFSSFANNTDTIVIDTRSSFSFGPLQNRGWLKNTLLFGRGERADVD